MKTWEKTLINIIHTDLEYTGLPDSLRMKMCFFLSLHSAVCVSSSSSSGSSWGLSDTFSISLLAYWNLMNKHVNIAQVTCWSLFVHLSFLHSMFMTTFMVFKKLNPSFFIENHQLTWSFRTMTAFKAKVTISCTLGKFQFLFLLTG